MSSLLTNTSSMVALSTLRGVNKNLASVQNEISTGKKIGSAKDNAAIWAVSTVMDSDVKGFKAISDSLSLGASTVSVARTAAEEVTKLLQEIKGLVVGAQEENVDRAKFQTDIEQLRGQIGTIIDSAQFSGLNLVKGDGSIDFLSSLDRDGSSVSPSTITVDRFNLETTGGSFVAGDAAAFAASVDDASLDDGEVATIEVVGSSATTEGDGLRVTVGTETFEYILGANETINDGVTALAKQINDAGLSGVSAAASTVADPEAGTAELVITNGSGNDALAVTVAEGTGGTKGGGLAALAGINVDTEDTAVLSQALTDIEDLINVGIDAAAEFGSSQKRVEIQQEFITELMDALKTGIGALTDADMEEASARLQSLQVQQQLGVQALSIANQQPQMLLNLFR